MRTTEDNIEFLVNQFMREVMSRGYQKFRTMQQDKRSPFDDLYDLFEKFKSKYEEEQTVDAESVDLSKTESAKDVEIKYLKVQVEQLKQQLKDKEEMIELLKKQAKKDKKKKTDD